MPKKREKAAQPATEATSEKKTYCGYDYSVLKYLKSRSKDGRSRNYMAIVYPTKEQYEKWFQEHPQILDGSTGELIDTPHYDGADGYGDAPDDWQDILAATHMQALDELHAVDEDSYSKTKKPHYHVLLMYKNKIAPEHVLDLCEKIHAAKVDVVDNLVGMARYLQHLDDPLKFQYREAPRCYGGVDYEALITLPGDRDKTISEMIDYIRTNQIYSFAQFTDICQASNPTWFAALTRNCTYFIKEYIKSSDWTTKKGK